MDTTARLNEIKQSLSPNQLRYLGERITCHTDKEAAQNCGIPYTTVLSWPEKQIINEAVQLMIADALQASMQILQQALVRAAWVKVGGLKAKNTSIQQAVATEILDRFWGKPRQQNDVNVSARPSYIVLTWEDAAGNTNNP